LHSLACVYDSDCVCWSDNFNGIVSEYKCSLSVGASNHNAVFHLSPFGHVDSHMPVSPEGPMAGSRNGVDNGRQCGTCQQVGSLKLSAEYLNVFRCVSSEMNVSNL
jgi:hypothetical protein